MKWDKIISGGTALFGSIVSYLFGGWDMFLRTLALFMVVDYSLGVTAGYVYKELSSQTAFKGILKKVAILAVVTVAYSIDTVTNAQGVVRGAVIFFYIGLEGVSILENAAMLDAPIPEKLKDALIQLKEGNKKEMFDNE